MPETIGIFSSSSPLTATAPRAAEHAIRYLEQCGHTVKKGRLFGRRDFYRSGSIRERAEEFNELLYDPEVTCLMGAVGGMVSNALLPYLDYDFLKAHPKKIIGHSDVTAILLSVYQKTGLTAFYGPNLVTSFGQHPPFLEYSLQSMERTFAGKCPFSVPMPPFYSDELTDWRAAPAPKQPLPNKWTTVQSGSATGRLIGGNLNTINGMMASPYMPQFREGDILFLEDTEKFAAHAERYYAMLKICGVFDKVSGILLGKHRQFDDQGTGRTPADILLEVLDGQKIPILADIDCCHTLPMMTLPIGGTVHFDADRQTIQVLHVS